MTGCEQGAGAQVHDPLPGVDPSPQLGGVCLGRRREVRLGRAGGVGRRHVCVVGGVGAEAGEELADVGLFVLDEHRIGLLLLADRRRCCLGLGRGAERSEAVGREHFCCVGQQCGEFVGRGVLGVDQVVGVAGTEQVGAACGAVQQGSAGEDGHLRVAGRVGECVGQVGEGVSRCGDRGDSHPWTDLDDLSVPDRRALEGHAVLGVDQVVRTGTPGQCQAPGDIVVVDVGLEHMGQSQAVPFEQRDHPVDVALGVHDEGLFAVVHEIAAVAQCRCLEGDHRDAGRGGGMCPVDCFSHVCSTGLCQGVGVQARGSLPVTTARRERIQPPVPPATE